MRKNVAEGSRHTVPMTVSLLQSLEKKGFQFVQVKGFTSDKHFDYVDPRVFIMVPMKELPTDPLLKDIYEPINSELLKRWASENDEMTEFRVAMN
ncbi:MAG TPA: hypothetical protein VJT83_09575 [Chitinophagaceae bacterium]|nr:hypothetical protein [Chitinophagaceae bacterium]